MELLTEIEAYLAEFRRQQRRIARRQRIGDEAYVAWRLTEQATGFEAGATLVGWLEQTNGPPTILT